MQALQHLRVSLSIAAIVLIVCRRRSRRGVLRVPTATNSTPAPPPPLLGRVAKPSSNHLPQLLLQRQSAVISVFPVCHAGGSSTSLASAADSTQAPRCRVSERGPSAGEPSPALTAPVPLHPQLPPTLILTLCHFLQAEKDKMLLENFFFNLLFCQKRAARKQADRLFEM